MSQGYSETEVFKREHLLGKNARDPEGDLTKTKQNNEKHIY